MASQLFDKSKAFALEVIKACNQIKKAQRESILTNQPIRSGTSIGANIREAFYAHGKADFIAKLQIALKVHFTESISFRFHLSDARISLFALAKNFT